MFYPYVLQAPETLGNVQLVVTDQYRAGVAGSVLPTLANPSSYNFSSSVGSPRIFFNQVCLVYNIVKLWLYTT